MLELFQEEEAKARIRTEKSNWKSKHFPWRTKPRQRESNWIECFDSLENKKFWTILGLGPGFSFFVLLLMLIIIERIDWTLLRLGLRVSGWLSLSKKKFFDFARRKWQCSVSARKLWILAVISRIGFFVGWALNFHQASATRRLGPNPNRKVIIENNRSESFCGTFRSMALSGHNEIPHNSSWNNALFPVILVCEH